VVCLLQVFIHQNSICISLLPDTYHLPVNFILISLPYTYHLPVNFILINLPYTYHLPVNLILINLPYTYHLPVNFILINLPYTYHLPVNLILISLPYTYHLPVNFILINFIAPVLFGVGRVYKSSSSSLRSFLLHPEIQTTSLGFLFSKHLRPCLLLKTKLKFPAHAKQRAML